MTSFIFRINEILVVQQISLAMRQINTDTFRERGLENLTTEIKAGIWVPEYRRPETTLTRRGNLKDWANPAFQ